MPTEKEMLESKKAMAYDLYLALKSNPEKTEYTREEIETLIDTYIIGLSQ